MHKDAYRDIFNIFNLICIVLASFIISSCGHKAYRLPRYPHTPPTQQPYEINGRVYYPLPSAVGYSEVGYASWYGKGFHGRPTASGEIYNMYAYTAAHKTLPLGTYCLVENLSNGKRVVVKVNDRGPFVKNRIIDLSYSAAKAIGMIGPGVTKVRITALGQKGKRLPDLVHGNFYVQVGAFKVKDNAVRLKRQLKKRYKNVRIKRRYSPRGPFFGVQLYAGSNIKTAKKMEKQLEREGFKEAFIISAD